MAELKSRIWRVQVAGVRTEDLDIEFDIEKNLKHEPNKCSLTIYNLSETNRAAIEQLSVYDTKTASVKKSARVGTIPVQIMAGYKETGLTMLFQGLLRRGISDWNGRDWSTEIVGEDGGEQVFSVRVSKTYPPGTSKMTVVNDLIDQLSLGEGNLTEVADKISVQTYPHGTTVSGCAADALQAILRACKVKFSIQDGQLQFLAFHKGLSDTTVRSFPVSVDSGLIGVPQVDATGEVVCRTLLIPGIAPGVYITLKSKGKQKLMRVQAVRHFGSTFGQDWYHEMRLLPG